MGEIQTTVEKIEELCHGIQKPERIYRQTALKEFYEIIQTFQPGNELIPTFFDSSYLHIFKCYTDKYEMNRSLACLIINSFIEKLPDNDFYLGVIVPVITKRIGMPEIIEDSEEMRLELIEQLLLLIAKFKAKTKKEDRLFSSYNNIIDILLRTLKDPHPLVQRKSCAVIVAMASEKCFHFRAEVLSDSLSVILGHRHSANRIAALEALGYLCLNIYTNGDLISNIIMQISPLLMDSMGFVRRECGRVGCLLLLKLRDRYSYFEKLVPLVLCCLSDESEEIRNDIDKKWIECGDLYFKENETELSPKILVDDIPLNYMVDIKRPTLGCRAIVQRSLRMLNVTLYEMEDWKDEVRLHSLKLLGQIVIHCEKYLTSKFMDIYPVLAKSCRDSEASIVSEAIKVSEMMGILLEYDSWKEHGIEGLKTGANMGYIKCFSLLYKKSGETKYESIINILDVITKARTSYSNQPQIQKETLQLLEILTKDSIIFHGSDMSQNVEKLLYCNILNIIALTIEDSPELAVAGEEILKILSENRDDLHKKYLSEIIDAIEGLDSSNSGDAEPIVLINGYLRFCGFQNFCMTNMQNAVKTVLENAEPEGKIRVLGAVAIASLKWNFQNKISLQESTQLLRSFITEIILPSLVWKVGRSAESIRSMASAVLCSLSENAIAESNIILPEIVPNIISLIEDNHIATRTYSLRCLLNCGPIDPSNIKELGLAVVSRLDDPGSEVRVLAALCLGTLRVNETIADEQENWRTILGHILNVTAHHIDDPDIKLRAALLDSLKILGKHYKPLILELIGTLKTRSKEVERLIVIIE